MSINVTVTANPVQIRRGKMVTSSYDPSKSELEKRRLMRLEQVRKQSKDIAQKVRNKVQKNNCKPLSDPELKGKTKLKDWQTRKLLELQNQYQDALDDIGLGHKEIDAILKDDKEVEEKRVINQSLADKRGKEAIKQLQNEKKLTTTVRHCECSKSAKKTPNVKAKQLQNTDDSENIDAYYDCDEEEIAIHNSEIPCVATTTKGATYTVTNQSRATSPIKEIQTTSKEDPQIDSAYSRDTRISQRIRQRLLSNKLENNREEDNFTLQTSDFDDPSCVEVYNRGCQCNLVEEKKPIEVSPREKKSPKSSKKEKSPKHSTSTEIPKMSFRNKRIGPDKEIPLRPKITLKSKRTSPTHKLSSTKKRVKKVPSYDHSNKHTSYLPSTHQVDKMTEEDYRISPAVSEIELGDKKRLRTKEAQIRGQKALEKEKIERDYREMLKKLPLLQKQERLCDISSDKPKYHMGEERLQEAEQKRQNNLDNAYEKLFAYRKPAIVTLPKIYEDTKAEPCDGKWDTDCVKDCQEKRVAELTELLQVLQRQKCDLLKELDNLPVLPEKQKSQVSKTDDSIKKCGDDKQKKKRKRAQQSSTADPTSSDNENGRGKKIIVLQNTSTQTTPKPILPCQNDHKKLQPCTCEVDVPEVPPYQILIKIKPSDQPKVEVKPSKLSSGVKKSTKDVTNKATSLHEDELWKTRLTHSSSLNTTSTSYMSPPDKLTAPTPYPSPRNKNIPTTYPSKADKKTVSSSESERSTSSECQCNNTILKHKISSSSSDPCVCGKTAQKEKIITSKPAEKKSIRKFEKSNSGKTDKRPKKIDSHLLMYIMKLLEMSHQRIDNLSISSASEVSTPSESTINIITNNPTDLKLLMKYFNITPADISQTMSEAQSKQLSEEEPEAPPVPTISTTHQSIQERIADLRQRIIDDRNANLGQSIANSHQMQVKLDDLCQNRFKERLANLRQNTMQDSIMNGRSVQDSSSTPQNNITEISKNGAVNRTDYLRKHFLQDYDKVYNACNLKIAQLTDMIENIRSEQKQILNSYVQENPQLREATSKRGSPNKSKSPTTSEEEPRRESPNKKKSSSSPNSDIVQSITPTIQLNEEEAKNQSPVKDDGIEPSNSSDEIDTSDFLRVDYSFAKHLRKASDEEIHEQHKELEKELKNLFNYEPEKRNKPPPPTTFKRPLLVPHELSTIIEADDVTSIQEQSKSKIGQEEEQKLETTAATTSSSSDNPELEEALEDILMNLGMSWAIPTLRKTREALAISTSSSGDERAITQSQQDNVRFREILTDIAVNMSQQGKKSDTSKTSKRSSISDAQKRRSPPENTNKTPSPVPVDDVNKIQEGKTLGEQLEENYQQERHSTPKNIFEPPKLFSSDEISSVHDTSKDEKPKGQGQATNQFFSVESTATEDHDDDDEDKDDKN